MGPFYTQKSLLLINLAKPVYRSSLQNDPICDQPAATIFGNPPSQQRFLALRPPKIVAAGWSPKIVAAGWWVRIRAAATKNDPKIDPFGSKNRCCRPIPNQPAATIFGNRPISSRWKSSKLLDAGRRFACSNDFCKSCKISPATCLRPHFFGRTRPRRCKLFVKVDRRASF